MKFVRNKKCCMKAYIQILYENNYTNLLYQYTRGKTIMNLQHNMTFHNLKYADSNVYTPKICK